MPGAHFRAHERREVRLAVILVGLVGQRSGVERQAVVVDLSLAGAGLETDEPLVPGERLTVTLSTPTMWDPLVIDAVVAWAHPPRASTEVDSIGRSRTVARAGVVFDYPNASLVLSLFEMLATLGFE
ncbi:MAG: hypothetical protein JWO86_3334 [Myxococcaceae bacterium]|jgi:hypothetical protein|nr:hypothetical protein [Myxococcaceae bacterium]MEA2750474.1 hypothetical protein [Myxococcales bacterium]